MEARAYVESHAREFIDPEADLTEILAAPLVFIGVGLDSDRAHAPNERIDLSLLLRGAEVSAYLWEELASAGSDLT